MAPNENAYSVMACRNVKRTGVISIRHFAFDFEVIRCNRNACGHVCTRSALFGRFRYLWLFLAAIDVCRSVSCHTFLRKLSVIGKIKDLLWRSRRYGVVYDRAC